MKKLFSLLTLALLTMSAWAQTTVTFVPGETVGSNTGATSADTMSKDGVTISTTKGAFAAAQYRFAQGSTTTVTSTVGNITKVEFTSTATYGSQYGPDLFTGDGYSAQSGSKVGTWAGNAVSFSLSATAQVRCSQIVVTIADPTSDELVPPVFHPNGGEFTGSLEVSLTCPTPNAEIQYYECDPETHEIDWTTYRYYTEPFYVTETKSFAAFSSKSNEVSDYIYADFTKVLPTCATPTFTPASGATFTDSETVRIDCATEGATIMYQVNNGDVEMDEAPVYIEITETSTITAFASCDGYNDSQEVTATFTKLSAYNVGNVVEFVALTDTVEGGTTAGWHTIVKDGVTMKFYGTVSNYTADNGTEYHQYRIYKNNTIQFTTAAGNIRKIEFDCDETNPVTGFNAIDGLDMTTATWEGNTRDITFTAGSKQVRANTITVTLDDQVPAIVVAAPTFDPAECEFEESIDVTINCATEGATLHYVVGNGDDQTATAPVTVTLTETTTITAYAELDGVESEIVEATYTLKEATGDITTLAQARALEDNTEFTFGGNVVVVYKNGSNLWVKDETASGLIYGSGLTNFEQGTVLNSGWSAKKVMYQTIIPEFSNPANVTDSEQEKVTVEPTVVEISAIDASMMNDYIRINNVTIDSISSSDNKNYYANGMVLRNQFGGITLEAGKTYSLIGLATAYKGVPQVYITEVVDAPQPEVYDVNNIAEALALDPNSQFTMYNDVVVTYHNGKRLFIRDTDGNSGMIYDTNNAIEGTFANGQVLSDGWTAKYEVYNGLPEFTNPVDVAADGNNTRVADPYEYTTITDANVNEYVIMKGLTILPDAENSKNFYNAADSLLLYDQFGVQPTIEEGKTYDVIGAVTIYKNKVQLYIISVTEVAAAGLRGDVNNDTFVNISDVTVLIDYLLNPATVINEANANVNLDEAINISDVTTLIDFLLSGTWPNK
ncbi:MAG: hypothetical protein E7078_07190 [Bacteroidales bacterium]|nr:hypothetical protein [Bacteroidales bacterium]